MLFQPEAHEALADEPWSAERARTAIASIVADAESAFDDGWPTHPQDVDEDDDASTQFRTVYLGGAGVVDALYRLARRGFAELRRDYVPYLERSLEAGRGFPDPGTAGAISGRHTGSQAACSRSAMSPPPRRRSAALPSRRMGWPTGRVSRGCDSAQTATAGSARSGATGRQGSSRRLRTPLMRNWPS